MNEHESEQELSVDSDSPQPETVDRADPWNPLESVGIAALAFVVAFAVSYVMVHAYASVAGVAPGSEAEEVGPIAMAAFLALPMFAFPQICVFLGIAGGLRRGWTPTGYLAIRTAGAGWMIGVPVVVAALWYLWMQWTIADVQANSPDFVYGRETVGWIVRFELLITRETVMRGFLFRSFAASRLGPKGAILLTAALPAVYLVLSGAFAEATTLLLLGIGLGIVRERTGSIAPGLLASAAMIAVEYSLRG